MVRVEFKSLVDPNSIIVINRKGLLRKLYCPFRILCIETVGNIQKNTWCYVDRVEQDPVAIILYNIGGYRVPYHHFHIYINF